MTLTKQQMIREIARRTGIRNSDVDSVLASLLDMFTEEIAAGGRIEIENFLVLEVLTRTRQPRQDRSLTEGGTPIETGPVSYRTLKVRPGKKLRAVLQKKK